MEDLIYTNEQFHVDEETMYKMIDWFIDELDEDMSNEDINKLIDEWSYSIYSNASTMPIEFIRSEMIKKIGDKCKYFK